MTVLVPLLDLENPNKFVWLRSFPSLDERDEMKNDFYEGELWKNELEAIAMPMLDRGFHERVKEMLMLKVHGKNLNGGTITTMAMLFLTVCMLMC